MTNVKKEELIKATNVAKEFTFEEIKIATNNFSKLLGRGGFGLVYKGYLSVGLDVAIKILSDTSNQGPQEFLNEVFNLFLIICIYFLMVSPIGMHMIFHKSLFS